MSETSQAVSIVFRAPSGKAFAFLKEHPYEDGEVLFSPDGETFYALAIRGQRSLTSHGVLAELDLTFEDPHHGVTDGKLHYEDGAITYGDEMYAKQADLVSITVVPLPATRRVEYFCQSEDGTLVYISSDKYKYEYESFRLFVGDGATMREIPVWDVQRFRDGGTTRILTSEGTFYSPSPFAAQDDPTLVPMWNEQRLTRLNADDYNIVEADGNVSISKR